MQDIDFDEIDRAVSSVTNSGASVSAPIESLAAPMAVTSVSTPMMVSEPAPTLVASSFATRRSTGRFMDVVHPSSDMRSKTSLSTPMASSFHREEAGRTVVAPRPTLEAPVSTSSAFHWPDPVEIPESRSSVPTPIVPNFELPSIPDLQPELVVPVVATEEPVVSSLESPFLSDAKVEKRPLGAFSVSDSDLPLLDDFNASLAELVAEEPIAVIAPEETETMPVTEPEIPVRSSAQSDELLLLEDHTENEEVQEAENPLVVETLESTHIEDIPVGPTSITQQYKEQPSTASQPSGSIYDTEAYRQPLVHPAKKSSSLLVVVWIVALIIAGGGIGAAVYFFVLPLLQA